jgi:hypothetical protein
MSTKAKLSAVAAVSFLLFLAFAAVSLAAAYHPDLTLTFFEAINLEHSYLQNLQEIEALAGNCSGGTGSTCGN